MEIIAKHKTKEYNFRLVDEKRRIQKVSQEKTGKEKTGKEYFLIVSDIDLVEKLDYVMEKFEKENAELKNRVGDLSNYAEKLENECANYSIDIEHIIIGEE